MSSEIALRDRRIGVARRHGLALLGHAQSAAERRRGLRADRLARGTTATTECAAAAVEDREHDVGSGNRRCERELRAPQRDRRRDIADLFTRVGVADHHLQLATELAAQDRIGERLGDDPIGALEILELLEQRHRPQLARREARGAAQEHDLEEIRDLAREADHVALARARPEIAASSPDHVECREQLARICGQAVAVAERRERLREDVAEHATPALLVEIEIIRPAAAREQLGDDGIVDARVLADVERGEVKPEHVDPADRVAQILIGDLGEPGGAQAAIEQREIRAVTRRIGVAILVVLERRAEPCLHVPQLLAPRLVLRARLRVCRDLGEPIAIRDQRRLELVERVRPRAQRR